MTPLDHGQTHTIAVEDPMVKKKPKRPSSGGARMSEKGYHPVNIWLTPEELELIDRARQEFEPRTHFIKQAAIIAARRKVRR